MSLIIVPSGIKLKAIESSVTFRLNSNTNQLLNIYGQGTVEGINFDANGGPFSARMIQLTSGGIFQDNHVYGAQNMTDGEYETNIIAVKNTFGAIIRRNYFENAKMLNNPVFFGDIGSIRITNSTGVYFSENIIKVDKILAGGQLMQVMGSSQVWIEDNTIENANAIFLTLTTGNKDIFFRRNKVNISSGGNVAGGTILVFANTNGISTGNIVIEGNDFITMGSSNNITNVEFSSATIIRSKGNATAFLDGLSIKNNTFTCNGGPSGVVTAIDLNNRTNRASIFGNHSMGCSTFLIEAGVSTTQTENRKDGVVQ